MKKKLKMNRRRKSGHVMFIMKKKKKTGGQVSETVFGARRGPAFVNLYFTNVSHSLRVCCLSLSLLLACTHTRSSRVECMCFVSHYIPSGISGRRKGAVSNHWLLRLWFVFGLRKTTNSVPHTTTYITTIIIYLSVSFSR